MPGDPESPVVPPATAPLPARSEVGALIQSRVYLAQYNLKSVVQMMNGDASGDEAPPTPPPDEPLPPYTSVEETVGILNSLRYYRRSSARFLEDLHEYDRESALQLSHIPLDLDSLRRIISSTYSQVPESLFSGSYDFFSDPSIVNQKLDFRDNELIQRFTGYLEKMELCIICIIMSRSRDFIDTLHSIEELSTKIGVTMTRVRDIRSDLSLVQYHSVKKPLRIPQYHTRKRNIQTVQEVIKRIVQIKGFLDQVGKYLQSNEYEKVMYSLQRVKSLITPDLRRLKHIEVIQEAYNRYDQLLAQVLFDQIIPLFLMPTPDRSTKLFPYLTGLLQSGKLLSVLEKYKAKATSELVSLVQAILTATLPKSDESKELRLFQLPSAVFLSLLRNLAVHLGEFFDQVGEVQSLLNGLLANLENDLITVDTQPLLVSVHDRNELHQLVSSITPTLWLEAQKHLVFLLNVKRSAKNSKKELEGMYKLLLSFLDRMDDVLSLKGKALLNSLNAKIKQSFEETYSRSVDALESSCQSETWKQTLISEEQQNLLRDWETRLKAWSASSSSPSVASVASVTLPRLTGVNTALEFCGQSFRVTSSLLVLLFSLLDLCDWMQSYPSITMEGLHRMNDLLGLYHSRVTVLILEAGSVKNKTIKKISPRILALTHQNLESIIHFVPSLKLSLKCNLSSSQQVLFVEFDRYVNIYKSQLNRISDTIVKIVVDIVRKNSLLISDISWNESPAHVNDYIHDIVSSYRLFYKQLAPILRENTLSTLLSKMVESTVSELISSYELIQVSGLDLNGRNRMIMDVTFLLDYFRTIQGLTNRGYSLEQYIRGKLDG